MTWNHLKIEKIIPKCIELVYYCSNVVVELIRGGVEDTKKMVGKRHYVPFWVGTFASITGGDGILSGLSEVSWVVKRVPL